MLKKISKNHGITRSETLSERLTKDYKNAINYERESSNPKFHRTDREEDLSFNFSIKNSSEISNYERQIYAFVECGKSHNIDLNIELCEKSILAFHAMKKFCYKTKGGTIYFQDMWEYCHNSKSACFSYLEIIERQLNDYTNNYDFYRLRYSKEKNLTSIILEVLKDSNHAVIQNEFYKQIPEVPKSIIRKEIDKLSDKGTIVKAKKGNKFYIFMRSTIM